MFSVFEEPEDPTNRSFFSEIISSISDVKFSHNGRYLITRDYLSVKVWDLHMDSKPIETYQVHEYLRSKLCSLYENDCIFDKFECAWSGNDRLVFYVIYNQIRPSVLLFTCSIDLNGCFTVGIGLLQSRHWIQGLGPHISRIFFFWTGYFLKFIPLTSTNVTNKIMLCKCHQIRYCNICIMR